MSILTDSLNKIVRKDVKNAWHTHLKEKFVYDPQDAGGLITVEYTDGTGNTFTLPNLIPYYIEGVKFEHEPSGHIDPYYFNVIEAITNE